MPTTRLSPSSSPAAGAPRRAASGSTSATDRPCGSDDPPAPFYRYSPDRKGERPQAHPEPFTGVLQTDAYAGFTELYCRNPIAEAACWAHARRKIHDVHAATASPIAEAALQRIVGLYEIEDRARGRPPDERRRLRLAPGCSPPRRAARLGRQASR